MGKLGLKKMNAQLHRHPEFMAQREAELKAEEEAARAEELRNRRLPDVSIVINIYNEREDDMSL